MHIYKYLLSILHQLNMRRGESNKSTSVDLLEVYSRCLHHFLRNAIGNVMLNNHKALVE